MGCGTGCIKVLLICLNMLFWIFGLGLLAVGVWLKVDPEVANMGEVLNIGLDDDVVDIASWVLIGSGIFAFFVGFFGCCGAIKESPCLLGFYMTCLVLIFAAEIGIAVFVGIKYDKLESEVTDVTKSWLQKKYDDKSIASKGFNYLQIKFCCCGVENYMDYKGSVFLQGSDSGVKDGLYMSFACCNPGDEKNDASGSVSISNDGKEKCEIEARELNGTIPKSLKKVNDQCDSSFSFRGWGCKDSLLDWAKERLPILFGVGAGVAFVQIFVFILTVCLCRSVRREKD